MPISRLIIDKKKKVFLISEIKKCKNLLKKNIINLNQLIETKDFSKKILSFKKGNCIIDNNSCSIFFEDIIRSKFKIVKREDPIYLFKSIKNENEIINMKKAHILDGVALTKFI